MLYSALVYKRAILPRTPVFPKLNERLTTSRKSPPMLKIHNSLKREKQVFTPIEPGKVRMYVCGMTVYDYCHLGHARVMVVFDMVYRWLKASGYDVTYVRNIPDIADQIIKRPGYGKLSGKSLDDLRAGERVEVDSAKQDPLDFVLWKHAKAGEPAWQSPWGDGRPGWHIECSAMSSKLLGQHFDIHGGGQDLQFPHHENEIAQSEGAHQCSFVNYWMHNGFVRVDNEKMSKSLGNFFTIRTVLERYDAEVVRFFILRAQYRSPLNYSDAHLDDAKRSLDSLYFTLRDVPPAAIAIDWNNEFAARFAAALNEDFDSSGAIAVLFELAAEANRQKSGELAGLLKALGGVIGLLEREPQAYLQGGAAAGPAAAGRVRTLPRGLGLAGAGDLKRPPVLAVRSAESPPALRAWW